MRCTKCSFISFDDLSACAKCSSDLSHLSKELNGTCIETRQDFFLGTAIQATGLAEVNFSDSQALPPIDHSGVNFDDTNTSRFPPAATSSADDSGMGFDDSLSLTAEDDVAIELGDIMPLDLDQLDSLSLSEDMSLERTDALPTDDLNIDFNRTNNISVTSDNQIDLDLTDSFDDSGSGFKFNDDLSDIEKSSFALNDDSDNVTTSLFGENFADLPTEQHGGSDIELDQDLFQQFSDSGSLDETISLDVNSGMEETDLSRFLTGEDAPAPLDLDESLVAELSGASSLDASGEFSVDFSTDHAASGEFVLDDALVAELASDENVAIDREPQFEFADNLSANQSAVSGVIEDLTGDFPPIREGDDVELSGLDLADIDVSDLIENSGGVSGADTPGESGLLVEDTIRDAPAASLQHVQDLGFDETSVGEGLAGFDDLGGAGVEMGGLAANDIDFSAGDASPSLEPVAVSLNDTLQEGDEAAALPHSDEEDVSDDDISLTDLSLDYVGEVEDLSLGVDALAFDDELESFLVKEGAAKKNPVLELIADDDEDGPPDLPR